MADTNQPTRISEARATARDLLEQLESQSGTVSQSLLKAKRLARLLRDTDAQTWLDLELRGYPTDFAFSTLGSCEKYVVGAGRLVDGKYWKQSLPELEARAKADQAAVAVPTAVPAMAPVSDFLAGGATIKVLEQIQNQATMRAQAYQNSARLFSALQSAIHAYATDAYIALELGDIATDVIEQARAEVDVFVRETSGQAAQQLVAINERLRESDAESLSAALNAARRLLMSVADAVFAARDTPHIDGAGKQRDVGAEQYKNRLLAFLESRLEFSDSELVEGQLAHLAARLDAVYDKTCKGVHANVSLHEARLTVIHVYLFLAEVARAARLEPLSSTSVA